MPGCYKLTAKNRMGSIPSGFALQVPTTSNGEPYASEVEQALKRAGFTDSNSLSYSSPRNWLVEKM